MVVLQRRCKKINRIWKYHFSTTRIPLCSRRLEKIPRTIEYQCSSKSAINYPMISITFSRISMRKGGLLNSGLLTLSVISSNRQMNSPLCNSPPWGILTLCHCASRILNKSISLRVYDLHLHDVNKMRNENETCFWGNQNNQQLTRTILACQYLF